MSRNLPAVFVKILSRAAGGEEVGDRITWETVDAVQEDGTYMVAGINLPPIGRKIWGKGDKAPVVWKDGARIGVLGHQARRAQPEKISQRKVGGIVEELLVGNFDKRGQAVWYRNSLKAFKLGIEGKLNGSPREAKWQLDGKGFAVRCENGWYAVFKLDGRDPNKIDEKSPGTSKLLWQEIPLDSNVTLTATDFQLRRTRKWCFFIPHWNWGTSWVNNGTEEDPVFSCDYTTYGHTYDSNIVGEESAAVSSSKTFGLSDALKGLILDADSQPNVSAQVTDWFLDSDGHLKFVVEVVWDKFKVAATGSSTKNFEYPIGCGPQGMDGCPASITAAGSSVGFIGGGTEYGTLNHITEVHTFLYDANLGAIAWGTAPGSVVFGTDQRDSFVRAYEHVTGNQGCPPAYGEPGPNESYYGGADFNPGAVDATIEGGIVADDRTLLFSSTGTFQLFDPSRLPALEGPYYSELGGTSESTASLLDGAPSLFPHFYWHFNFSVRTGNIVLLYYHRVQYARFFQMNDKPRLFLVLERYHYVGGTGYLSDVPEIGVWVLNARTGAVIKTLRPWQYGLGGAEFISANAHRIVWQLNAPWISPKAAWKVTEFSTGIEKMFAISHIDDWKKKDAGLYSPDFMWNYPEPREFDLQKVLPTVKVDSTLHHLAQLAKMSAKKKGDVRVANEKARLAPFGRYVKE